MNIFFPTAFLMVQAGMIAGFAAAFAVPAMVLGMAQAVTTPGTDPKR